MSSSRSTGRKRRSWTAPPPILSARSIRSASPNSPARAAISKSSSRCASIATADSRNFCRPNAASASTSRSNSNSPAIGRQRRVFDLDPPTFRRDIARARTFGFVSDVKKLWQAGFALGSSLENSVAIDGDVILNPEGLRYADEFVRHKALDAIGDLSLAGAPIIGVYRTYRAGHKLNALALDALLRASHGLRDRRSAGFESRNSGARSGRPYSRGGRGLRRRRLILARALASGRTLARFRLDRATCRQRPRSRE